MLTILLAGAACSSAPAQDGDALVIVNGNSIPRKQVVEILMESHGLRIMQQLIALELAKQESRRQGAEVTQADIDAQFWTAVEEIAPDRDAAGVELQRAEKLQALQIFLTERGLTMPEFRIAMERNAHLRKAVESEFKVDEATLREEFARTHGAKVQIRHIQLRKNDTPTLHAAVDQLARGEDFAEVARRLSVNPETAPGGGLMPPFAFTDQRIPPALREVAFGLDEGQVSSPTLVEEMIHIIKLEQRIPPEKVRFEDVRDKVETQLRERVTRQKMTERMNKIFREAQIRVLDRKLKGEFEAVLKEEESRPPTFP